MQNYEEYELTNLYDESATLKIYGNDEAEVTFPDGTTVTYNNSDKADRILRKNGFRY